MHKFLVNIGITKVHVLEEIFHELAQVTKSQNIEEPRKVNAAKKQNTQNILSSYLSLFPKECGVDFEKLEVSLIRVDINRNLNLIWNKCYASVLQPTDVIDDLRFSESHNKLVLSDSELNLVNPKLPNDVAVEEVLKFKTGCYGLRISSCVSTATSWRRLELSGQFDVGSVNVKCRIDNPCLIVNVDELAFWHELIIDAQSLFRQLKRRSYQESTNSLEDDSPSKDSLHYALKLEVNCSHRGQAINLDSLAVIQIINNSQEPGLEFGLKSLVASYEADTPNDDAEKLIQSIDLYSDINTAYCKLIKYPSHERCEYIDYFHRWDTSLFMGNVFIWIHKNRTGCLMNQVQLEWSNGTTKAIAKIFETIHMVRSSQVKESSTTTRTKMSSNSFITAFAKMNLEMKLEHVDIFAVSSRRAFLRQKINIIQVNKTTEESVELQFKFCRMVYDMIEPDQEIYPTTTDLSDDKEFSKYFKLICDVDQFTIEYTWSRKVMSIYCLDSVNGFWDPAIHLCTHESILNLKSIISSVSRIQKLSINVSSESSVRLNVHLEFKSGMNVKFILSKEHHTVVSSDNIFFVVGKQRSKMVANVLKIYCDDQEIFKIEKASWKEVVPTIKYRQDKEKLKLTDSSNRAWEIQADSILISFPYAYNFRDWYHDIISIKKFVKNVGANRKVETKQSQTIPPDYIIFFKKLQIEVKDDPFECQLLDNYLVLRDENEEHEKRILRMRSQLKKLTKNGGSYTDSDYQKCLLQLDLQKQSQYISRISSIRSCVNNQPVNNLLRWTLNNLSLMSLSDTDFYGTENAIRHMNSIDIDSPYPHGGMLFSTLWCRMISLNVDSWHLQMREYLKPVWEMKDLYVWGPLVVAEQSASEKSKRKVCISISDPWPDVIIERSMPTIKFFHDFSADVKEHRICYGPNWEPCLQWINISMERINRPSRDPSPPLPWWDKNRFRFHGRLWFAANVMDWYYPVSLDPYNNTEFFHWQWTSARVNWENMKWLFDGNLDIFCRSASKYDGDCQLLSWPNIQLKIDIEWICIGNPNDHFSIVPIAPDYVTAKDHDTYYLFRSRNVNLSFEIKSQTVSMSEFPRIVFYTNIIKFFEKFKMCIGRVARPIRRGHYFNYFRRRKAVLGRHYKFINFKLNLPQLDLVYWVSLARKSGVHMTTGPISLSAQFQLQINKVESTLYQRPQSSWSVVQMKSQLRKGKVWLIQTAEEFSDDKTLASKYEFSSDQNIKNIFHEKNRYEFIILSHLKYERMSAGQNVMNTTSSTMMDQIKDIDSEYDLTPKHNLKLVDLKVRWTETNRNLVYSMIDIYRHKTLLRKNLSAQALKSIQLQMPSYYESEAKRNPITTTNYKSDDSVITSLMSTEIRCNSDTNINKKLSGDRKRTNSDNFHQVSEVVSSRNVLPVEQENVMLRQLLQEVDTAKLYAYCEEESKVVNVVGKLTGLELSKSTPKVSRNWHLELNNSQVMLKTTQSSGYVIVSAAHTVLDSNEHLPLWKDSQLLIKSSIVGKLECMQYYATVGKISPSGGQHWLNMCDVEDLENNEDILSGTPEVVGCGKAVGGVVSSCIGHIDPVTSAISASPSNVESPSKHINQVESAGRIQLQRMISKCSCMVYYISYDRADPNVLSQHLIPPLPLEEDEVSHSSEGAMTLTILHSNLNVVTNSLQYHMIVDIINDLILYVEPQRKARDERNKVEFSLLNEEQLKMTILRSQEGLRHNVHLLIRVERELRKAVIEDQVNRIRLLENNIKQFKADIENKNSALSQCIVIYQQMRVQSQRRDLHMKSSFSRLNQCTDGFSNISNANKLAGQDNGKKSLSQSTPSESIIRSSAEVIRRNEVCFEHATWRMNENDGQIGLCDVELRAFIYSKITRGDDSGAHNFELNTVKVESLIDNCFFKEVLMMDDSSEMNIGGPVLRINLIERYPVGGIKVNEAIEICVAPLVLQISKSFYSMMMPYFFPEKGEDSDGEKVSDNMSFVKSESMDFKKQSDTPYNSEGILLGQHIEMTDLDQLLGEVRVNAEVTSPATGLTTKIRKLASLSNLRSLRKKDKIFSCSDDNLSPLSFAEPASFSLPSVTEPNISEMTPHNSIATDVVYEDIGSSGLPAQNLKIEDVLTNQYLAVDYLYQKSSKTTEMMSSDYTNSADMLPHSTDKGDKQSKRSLSDRVGLQNMKSDPTLNASSKDPLQLMAERAKQNYMFLYVKIHGFPIRLSYRGEKQKAFTINNFALNITPIEYHNRLWTWLDLTMEVKKSIKKQLVLEILKQKFKIKKNPFSLVSHSSFNKKMKEEDREKKKMEMLLGIHALPKEVSKKRHGLLQRVISKK